MTVAHFIAKRLLRHASETPERALPPATGKAGGAFSHPTGHQTLNDEYRQWLRKRSDERKERDK